MADNTMNKGGKGTDQDRTRRGQEDTQRSDMGNQREQGKGRQEEDTQRSNMGHRGQEEQRQSGRINGDMQRTDMANPANVPPQPHKSNVPEDEKGTAQKVSGSRGREVRDTDVDTNEGRSTEEDSSRRGL